MVTHCPTAFGSPKGISNAPVAHDSILFPVPGNIHGSLLVALFLPASDKAMSAKAAQGHWHNYSSMRLTRRHQSRFSMNVLISPEPTSHFTLTAPLSNMLQKVVKSRPSPWNRV